MAVRRLPLIGRDVELATLDDEVSRASAGELRVLLVTGEPGIGKTRLVAELLARHREMTALSARAHPFGETASLALWAEALERHLRRLSDDELRELCGHRALDLAPLLPSVSILTGGVTDRPRPQLALLEGLSHVLVTMSRTAPVVIALDDVHLADASSWEALHYLADQLQEERVLIVLAARPTELRAQPLASNITMALEQDGFVRRLALRPLSADAVERLAAAQVDDEIRPALVDWLMTKTQGSPLYVLGLLRALEEAGADLANPALHGIPEDLAQQVRSRVQVLTARAREVLETLAVLGYDATPGDLSELTGQSIDDLGELLDQLMGNGLVVRSGQPTDHRYQFSHPLMQEAVYEGIGTGRRRTLHRAAARMLAGAHRFGLAAPHFARSAEPGDAEAITALRVALHEAESREYFREGLALLRALLAVIPDGDPSWLDVLAVMPTQPEWVVDHRADVDWDVGITAMTRIKQVLEAGPRDERIGAVDFNLGVLLMWGRGDVASGAQLIASAEETFRTTANERARLIASNELGYAAALTGGSAAEFEAIARDVLRQAVKVGDPLAELQALCALLWALSVAHDEGEQLEIVDRGIELATSLDRPYRRTYLLAARAWLLGLTGDAAAATTQFVVAEASNARYRETHFTEMLTHVRLLQGDFTGTLAAFQDGPGWNGELSRRRTWGAGMAAVALAELGRHDEADRLGAVALAPLGGDPWFFHTGFVTGLVAVASWLRDDDAELDQPIAFTLEELTARGWWTYAWPLLADAAEIAAYRGDESLAALVRTCAARDERGPSGLGFRSAATFASGALLVVEGRHPEAVPLLDEAAAGFRAAGWEAYAARADALGGLAAGAGDRDAGAARLGRAVAVFRDLGASSRLARAERLLKALTPRRAGRDSHGPAVLTRREREVVLLAVEGLTAREIGARLYIGERTVETHLAHAYGKLGVASRVELAQLAPLLR